MMVRWLLIGISAVIACPERYREEYYRVGECVNNSTEKNTPNDHPLTRFQIENWTVDVATNRISQGTVEHKLETKAMEVLVYLAGRQGELVTREELEQNVWAGKVVGYDSLTSNINKLRKVLVDDSRQPRFIETVSKKGYRLIATIDTNINSSLFSEKKSLPSRWLTPGTMFAFLSGVIVMAGLIFMASDKIRSSYDEPLVESQGPSIVILPFVDLSHDSTQRYLGDGLTEDLTTALSKLSGLFVIARSSAVNYQDQALDVMQIAQQLDVQYVLEGSVRRDKSKLRVNASLIEGKSGVHLWSEHYDREMKDIFAVQDDITAKIVAALSVTLTEEEKRRVASKYTVSIAAYDEFLQGQLEYARRTREDNLWARESFRQSIDRDSNFARAYSALALTYAAEARFGWHSNPAASLDRAVVLAQKAVMIDDQLPQAHWVLGFVYLQQRKYDLAIESARRALRLSPNYADSYATLGVSYVYAGDPQKGAQMMRRAMRLSPYYPAAYASALGQAYYFLGQFEDALIPLRDAADRNVNLLTSQVFLVATLSRLGQKEDASWAADQLRTLKPDFLVRKVGEMFPIGDQELLRNLQADLAGAGLN